MSKNYKFKQLYIENTRNCNLNCPFCPSSSNRSKNLKVNDFREIILKTKDLTEVYYLHLLGEPLANPNLEGYLEVLKEYKKRVRITTNGTLLRRNKTLLLQDNTLERINISLQAWHYIAYDQVLNLIDDLVDFIQTKWELKPKLVVSLRFWNDKKNPKTEEFNKFLLNSLENKLKLSLKNNIPEKYLLISLEDEFTWPELFHPINPIFSKCLGGLNQLGILLNGDVVLCCLDYKGLTKIGNIYEHSLEEILEMEEYKSFVNDLNNSINHFELCKKCTFRNRFLK